MQSAADAIKEIETRASALGVAVSDVFLKAHVNPATWRLWQAGKGTPSYRITDAIEIALTRLERANGRAKR
jgi:hypothetical protein